MEKDLSTPEYYPLSLNALTNACNQKSNRDPVTAFTDDVVLSALECLRERGMAAFVSEAGSRVEKFRHRLSERLNLTRGETALLAVLLLRGPQTAAEAKDRCARMFAFDGLDTAVRALERLAHHEADPLVTLLERQPGQKEARWCHLLSRPPSQIQAHADAPPPGVDRISKLEAEVTALREELTALKRSLGA